ncbi:MAG: aminopeptidase C [Bacteroidales bacterium]
MNKLLMVLLIAVFTTLAGISQDTGYVFQMVQDIPCTPVKDQHRTSTCWSFSSVSFFESELLRMGKPELDLSEMFIVRHTYEGKADKYVRMSGTVNFAGGGAFHDALNVLRDHGLVPEEAYPGLEYGDEKHNHRELDAVLKGYMDAVVKNPNRRLSTAWMQGFRGILDAYLGESPETFNYQGKTYTPASFAEALGLNPDDYVILTSFTHHPFYEPFILEVPDNWAWGTCMNLPLEEFGKVIDNALNKGYTVAWASDMSDPGFTSAGLAIVPEKPWEEMDDSERMYVLENPTKQRVITQEMRQEGFDNLTTTDDHGMHLVGCATDQLGNRYYRVKNSWGDTGNYEGFWYASRQYVLYKSTNIMVHRDAIPRDIALKLGLE